jgi:hypothetical protein
MKAKISYLMVLVLAQLCGAVAIGEDADVLSLRKALFADDASLDHTFRVKDENVRLQAIRQLEANGSAKAVGILKDFLTTHEMERKLKQHALTALGRIGTKEAIDGILEFELWSRKRYTSPQPFHFGKTDHALDHFARYHLVPIATTETGDRAKWAVFPWRRYGKQDIWLTKSNQEGKWLDPILLNLPDMPHLARMSDTTFDKKCSLKIEREAITVACNGRTFGTNLSDTLRDSDADGLPDAVEARFSTNPSKPDSDEDGVLDGTDCNPLTRRHAECSDTTEIRQAVFSVLFATCASRDAIILVSRGPYAQQEYYGYGGPVLRSEKTREGFSNVTSFKVEIESETTASVRIRDYVGSLAASTHEAKLRKAHGKWIVVYFELTMIS